MQSLKDKTIKGTFWSAVDAFLGQGVTFFVSIVLARLLSPTEYGLIGICFIFINIFGVFVDSGFSVALIRKKDVTERDYNTMFITNMLFSIFVYIFLYVLAPYISKFFLRPELLKLIRVMGLVLIIQALSITQITLFTKRIDFKTKTKASLVSSIISGLIGIIMAILGFGVWALVGQQIFKQIIYSFCLWILNKWYPKFIFDTKSFQYMWRFGWKIMLSSLLDSIWNQLYQVVVGKFYSPSTLGQYSKSKEFASLFSSNFTTVVNRVTFPALAEIQDDEKRMIMAYRKVIKVSMFVTFVSMFSIGALAEPLLYCVIGPQWHLAATYLPLICLSLSLYPLAAINLDMLQIQGRSDIFLMLEIFKKTVGVAPLLVGCFINIYWMLIASIVVGIINYFLNSYYTGKRMGYSSWMQLKDISLSFCIGVSLFFSMYFLKFLPISYYIVLPTQILVGSVVLISLCEFSQNREYIELKGLLKITFFKVRETLSKKSILYG